MKLYVNFEKISPLGIILVIDFSIDFNVKPENFLFQI